jgi:hypothetical protein
MTLKVRSFGVKEASQRHPLLCNSFLKHISMATNAHTIADELLETVFSNPSATKLYKESQ